MNFLCFMDPIYEVVQPESSNVRNFTLRFDLLPHLLPSNKEDTKVVVVALEKVVKNFDCEKIFKNKNIDLITFNEEEVNTIFNKKERSLYIKNVANESLYKKFKGILKSKLGDIEFNIIFGWGFIPSYLEELYPNALILEGEHSLFTRYTSISDVIYLPRNKKIEENLVSYIKYNDLSNDERKSLINFRTELKHQINSFGILDKKTVDPSNKYEKFVFFPGHYECACFTRYSSYKNEYEILLNLIKATDEKTCILYTKHPLTKSSNIDKLLKASNKLINLNDLYPLNKDISYSAMMISDVVINSHSKMGIMAMLLGIPTIDIDNFISSKYTYNIDLKKSQILNIPTKPHKLADRFVFYFLRISHIHTLFTYPGAFLWFLEECYKNYINNLPVNKIIPITTTLNEIKRFAIDNKNNKSITKNNISRPYTIYDEIKFSIILSKNICFDIFDTLIQRPFNKPTDLFYLMSGEVSSIVQRRSFNFQQARSSAEWHARKKAINQGKEDTNLDVIYDSLAELYSIDKQTCEKIKNLEIKYELQFCFRRESVYNLFELAKAYNKNIFIISDMYLNKNLIEKILFKCGYTNYADIFISSEIGKMKRSGNLYNYVLATKNISFEETIMIGDNIDSDYEQAMKYGIKAFCIPSAVEEFDKKFNHLIFLQTSKKHNTCLPLGLVATKFFDNPYIEYSKNSIFNNSPYNLGYFLLGPLCMSFTVWSIKQILERKKYSGVFFAARDCYLIQKIYEKIRESNLFLKDNLPVSEYLYLSRSSTLPFLLKKENISSILDIYVTNYSAIDILKKLIGFDIDNSSIKKYKKKLSLLNLANKYDLCWFKDFILNNYDILIDDSLVNSEIESLKEYINSLLLKNNIKKISDVCFIDSGARGTSVDVLGDIYNTDIDILLLRQYRYKYNDFDNKEAYFKETFNMFRNGVSAFASRLYEPLISCASEGTCIGYFNYNNKISPRVEDLDITSIGNNIFITQQAILDFCSDYIKYFSNFYMSIFNDSDRIYESLLEFCFSGKTDREVFNSYVHTDAIWGPTRLDLILPPLVSHKVSLGNSKPVQQTKSQIINEQNKNHINIKTKKIAEKKIVYSNSLKNLDKQFKYYSNKNFITKLVIKPFWYLGRSVVINWKTKFS